MIFDSHAHYDDDSFNEDREVLLSEVLPKKGVVGIINCASDFESIEKTITPHDETQVYFREMRDDEIWAYVDSGDPMDKAGSYGIQGEAGKFVSSIEGSLNNVIGLPTELLKEILSKDFKIGDLI